MRLLKMSPLRLVTAALALGSGHCRALRADVLGDGWTYRRSLNFKQTKSDVPGAPGAGGDNLCWVEFYANGTQRPDAADFRVTIPAGDLLVPLKIMQASPDNDFVRLAFATHGDGPYLVSWGNPKAAKTPPLIINRGIYVEEYRPAGGDPRTAEGLQDMLDRARAKAPPEAATFVPTVFQGWNPLGEQLGAILHFHGQFKIDDPVTPDFAFTVVDAGTLAVDGKILAHNFRGGLRGRVRNPQALHLAPGWHSLDVAQVNQGSNNTAVAVVWQPPGAKQYASLSPSIFAPVSFAAAGPLIKIGAAYAADFAIDPQAEVFIPPDAFAPRYVFDVLMPANFSPRISWDFGDGQTAAGLRKINHYFLAPGTYPVTLKIEQGGNIFSTTQRILVRDRLYERFPNPTQDSPATAAAVLRNYDPSKLSGIQSLRGMLVLKDHAPPRLVAAWGHAWLQTHDAPTDKVLFDETFDLARTLQQRKDFSQAAEDFHLASLKAAGILTRLDLMRYEVMARCDDLNDSDAAAKIVDDWRNKINPANPAQARALESAALYAAVARGDSKAARQSLAAVKIAQNADYVDAQLQQGVLARNIENYIRTRDFDTALRLLNDWELDYPQAIWDGFTRTLRVKLLAAEGRPLIAARIAVQYAKINPASFYAAELLYRASLNFKDAADPTQAKAAMDLLTAKYPESPYAHGNAAPD